MPEIIRRVFLFFFFVPVLNGLFSSMFQFLTYCNTVFYFDIKREISLVLRLAASSVLSHTRDLTYYGCTYVGGECECDESRPHAPAYLRKYVAQEESIRAMISKNF